MKLETFFKDDGKDAEIMVILAYMLKKAHAGSRLTKKAILDDLYRLYGITMSRATFDKKLNALSHFGYKTIRNENKFWELIGRELDDAQIRFLADCLIYSNAVSQENAEEMIRGLCLLGSEISDKNLSRYISRMKNYSSKGKEDVMYTLGLVLDSIRREKKLSVNYKVYDKNIKIVKKYKSSIMISPYELVMSNGRYVLICAVDGEDRLSNFYLDRLTNALDTDEPIRPIKELTGFRSANDLEEYIKASPTLSGGIVDMFSIKCDNEIVGEIAEAFFGNVRVDKQSKESDTYNTVLSVRTTAETLKRVILPYADKVTVLNNDDLTREMMTMFNTSMHNSHIIGMLPSMKQHVALSLDEAVRLVEMTGSDALYYNARSLKRSEDISLLGRVGHIKTLKLYNVGMSTANNFSEYVPDVEKLHVHRSHVPIGDILRLKKLHELTVGDMNANALEMLHVLPELEKLYIFYKPFSESKSITKEPITDLKFLKRYPALRTLILVGFDDLNDISALKDLDTLEELYLVKCPAVKDFSVLYEMQKVQRIHIEDCGISIDEENVLWENMPGRRLTVVR